MQTFTKTREESLPSLKKYSKNVEEKNDAEWGKVVQERTYAEIDDPDQNEVPTELHKKAYNYGKQIVPVEAKEASGENSQMPGKDKKDSLTPKPEEI